MLTPARVALIGFGYLLCLFGVAYWAERRKDRGRSLISNPLVYGLSIAVYCTSWTFYGSVGNAANLGIGFLPVYIGPTLAVFTWYHVLRKMIRVARDNHITSVSDFVAFRYGKSGKIGALVALVMIVGITPYIGLQLKAVSTTFDILTVGDIFGERTPSATSIFSDTAFYVAIVMGIFGGMFGARTLDPSERHEGMVAAIALESLVKLAALVMVGIFVCWFAFDGPTDIFQRIANHRLYSELTVMNRGVADSFSHWFGIMALSMAAVMLLPRQFHMLVVENCSEDHIPGAMWIFTGYLFVINLFVIPIAFGGLLVFGDASLADTFVLSLPLSLGFPDLAMLAFLGGMSAATGMVVVSSVTLSTMMLNNLIMPVLLRLRVGANFAPMLIHIKRAGILFILAAGYGYFKLLGQSMMLINMGLISFGAVAQLVPVVIGGLYWGRATASGAATGLTMGFGVWGYMFLLPSLVNAGWAPLSWMNEGPLGVDLLIPTAFMGLTGLDTWSHGLFWSVLLNGGSFYLVSLFTGQSEAEASQARKFVGVMEPKTGEKSELRLFHAPNVMEFQSLLARFIGEEKATARLREYFGGRDLTTLGVLSDDTLVDLNNFVERLLGGAVGPFAAQRIVEGYLTIKGTKLESIFDVFGSVSLSLEENRAELSSRLRELSVLFEASKRVASTLDEGEAIGSVLSLIRSDLQLELSSVAYLEGELLTPSWPEHSSPIEIGSRANSYRAQAVRQCKTVFMADAELAGDILSMEQQEVEGLQSYIATPIIKEKWTLGVLSAGSLTRKGYFSDKFIDTFEALASELAMSITNARLFKEVSDLNRTLEEKVAMRTRELESANRNLKTLDKLKSQFMATMSHELRTPMNSILGYTQLILDGVDGDINEDQRSSLSRIDNNAKILLRLINEVLDLSKIEAGRMEISPVVMDVSPLAREVMEDLSNMAREKGLGWRFELDTAEPLTARIDPLKIREVLTNLLNNAIKFTESGWVSLAVSATTMDAVEGVEFVVEDTGIGIPPQNREDVFDAFKQVDGSSTRSHGGSGLGLHIAKKLVELHEGKIRVESSVEEGSRFTVWIPLAGPTAEGHKG